MGQKMEPKLTLVIGALSPGLTLLPLWASVVTRGQVDSRHLCPEWCTSNSPLSLRHCPWRPAELPGRGTESEIYMPSCQEEEVDVEAKDSTGRSSVPLPTPDLMWKKTKCWHHTILLKNERTHSSWLRTLPCSLSLYITKLHLFFLNHVSLILKVYLPKW